MGHKLVIRSNLGGIILAAEIIGDGDLPGTILVRGRQCWSWEGALNAASLANVGPTGGKIADYAMISIPPTDIIQSFRMSDAALVALAAIPPTERM